MKSKILEHSSKCSKRLRFSCLSQLIITEPNSGEDVQNAWYTKKEIAQFKRNVRLTSQALRKTRTAKAMKLIAHSAATGSPHANIRVHGKEGIRGIEHLLSPEVKHCLIKTRQKTITRVLEEQQVQKSSRRIASIAQVSETNSSFSKEWCTRIAKFQQA